MVDSRVKCSAWVLLEIDSDSVEMLLEQHFNFLEGRETFPFSGKTWKGMNSLNKSAQIYLFYSAENHPGVNRT